MAKSIPLEDLAGRLNEISRSHLITALHHQALRYSALAEKKAKHKASAVLTPRTGHLVQSITGRAKKGRGEIVISLRAGGGRKDVKYAKTHEQDGKRGSRLVIKPKSSKFLTIPVHPKLKTAAGVRRYPSARDVPGLTFAQSLRGQPLLLHHKTGEVWYLLRKSVVIESRPFLRPTVDLIRKKMLKDIAKALGEEILK